MLSKRPIGYKIALVQVLFARIELSFCQTRVGFLYILLSSERPRVVSESVNKLFPFHELINVERFWPPCCAVLRHAGFIVASNLTVFKLDPTQCRNTSQQGGQTHATCCAQQCCDMFHSHVAIWGYTRVLIWKIIGAVLSF